MAIVITEEQVGELIDMDDALRLVEETFAYPRSQRPSNQPRRRVGTGVGTLNVMSAAIPVRDVCGLKSYPVSRGGVNFTVLLYRASSSELLAIIEAATLGQLRTGAASGVATKYLARSDAHSLGLFGSGTQAETQLEAIAKVRPLSEVLVYSRNRGKLEGFCRGMSERTGIEVTPAEGASRPLECDIVTTATSSSTPVLAGEGLRDGCHVNAMGSNFASKAEVDLAGVSRASLVVVDSLESARIEGGDLLPAVDRGVLAWERTIELAEIVSNEFPFRRGPRDITLFKSHGVASEDIVLADEVYRRASERGVGREVSVTSST